MRIVDTMVWIDYLRSVHNAHADWLDANVSREPLGLTDLTNVTTRPTGFFSPKSWFYRMVRETRRN
jgi:hypothetical protein